MVLQFSAAHRSRSGPKLGQPPPTWTLHNIHQTGILVLSRSGLVSIQRNGRSGTPGYAVQQSLFPAVPGVDHEDVPSLTTDNRMLIQWAHVPEPYCRVGHISRRSDWPDSHPLQLTRLTVPSYPDQLIMYKSLSFADLSSGYSKASTCPCVQRGTDTRQVGIPEYCKTLYSARRLPPASYANIHLSRLPQ